MRTIKLTGMYSRASREYFSGQSTVCVRRFITVSAIALPVDLTDGRTISVPLEWYPRLAHGSAAERNGFRLIGPGTGIHWPDLDEDLNIEGPLRGGKSDESAKSFERWLAARNSTK
ncbi:MAG: DUF2442 domain-containing protein [Gemmatimonadaceae bacterium]